MTQLSQMNSTQNKVVEHSETKFTCPLCQRSFTTKEHAEQCYHTCQKKVTHKQDAMLGVPL